MTAGTAARLSPKVLLIDPVRMVPSLLLPLLGVLFAGGFSPVSYGWAAAGLGGGVVFAVVRWLTFTYAIVGDRLELRRSLISRSVKTIPLERIRGVDIASPPLLRIFGLAVLKIDTGATGQEGELNGVTLAEAERLKAVLLRQQHAAPAQAQDVLFKLPRRWLLYGPLSGAYLLTPFALAGGAIGLAFQIGEELGLGRQALRAGRELVNHPDLLILAILVLVVLMPIAGGIMYALFAWDFTLRSREGHLVAERGLLTRRSVSLESARVRGYESVDALAERWAGVVRVWAIVTGLGDSQTRGQLLPDVPRAVAADLTARAVGPYTGPLIAHPPVARQRRLFRAVAPWLALALAWAVLAPPAWPGLVLASLALAGLGVPLGLDRYRSLGHGYDGARLSVRSGSLRRSQAVVERRAVVGWRLRQTVFQRRSGVLTVIAGVGAGRGGYHAVDVSREQAVAFTRTVTPEWVAPFLVND
ncbi:PH domain-containing protein [Nonomuraea sp. NPDC050663]|uniref:PH domain-containing protein n=1 Tax=Nonomuraea sp. NPDC050663 TaxID=3364370 RepID=UPI00379E2348